ncbi:MAG TPA: hypothetical protein VGZ22_16525, partial [Isosphaeraceae bacterium]|nr:hypothetical protein [Isosphaeraceae bacterium]
ALSLYLHRQRSLAVRSLWRWTWTFSFLAYLVHFSYAWFGVFGGQVDTARVYPEAFHVGKDATILDLVRLHQGDAIAYSNLAVSVVWLLDVLLAWVEGRGNGFTATIHGLTWLYVLGSFLTATIYFYKNPTSYALGWVLVAAVAVSVVVRILRPIGRSRP